MNSHDRKRNRGSLSLIGHIRSLSRAAPYHERIPDEPDLQWQAPSSMSCNPHERTAPSSSPTTRDAVVTAESIVATPGTATRHEGATAFETPPPPYEQNPRTRPRSWLSLSRPALLSHPARSKSVQLPKNTSFATAENSVISAPTLVDTTNEKVAENEGVSVGGILYPNIKAFKREHKAHKASRLAGMMKSFKKHERRDHFVQLQSNSTEDVNHLSSIEKSIARRRAETVNLCREKINKLTGNGLVRRKSMARTAARLSQDSTEPPLLQAHAAGASGVPTSDELNSEHGSFTRSFASAINRLDFDSPRPVHKMGLIKSATAFFGLKKRNKKKHDDDREETSEDAQTGKKSQEITEATDLKDDLPDRSGQTAQKHSAGPQSKNEEQVNSASLPEPLQFDVAENTWVKSAPAVGYPRGVNPLAMHSNVTGFATPPSAFTAAKGKTASNFEPFEDDDDAIEDAPIYSPSSGDLSQYNRKICKTAMPLTVTQEQETPTRLPGENRTGLGHRVGLYKSKSGFGLFRKEAETDIAGRSNKENSPLKMRKSRSMLSVFRKDKEEGHGAVVERVPTIRDAFRAVATAESNVVRRTPPKHISLPRTLMRRRGVYGMPKPETDEDE